MNLLSLKIARKYIFSKKSYSAVNLISIVAVCGLVITTVAVVCVLSVFNGFSNLIESKLASIDPPIKVTAVKGKVINNADSLISVIKEVNGVALALPTLQENALAIYNNREMPVVIKGVPENYDSLTNIRDLIKEDGRYLFHNNGFKYAILSVGTAINMDARPGYISELQLFAPKRRGKINIANPIGAFRSDSLFVSGVFQVNQQTYDNNMVLVSLDIAKYLFDYDNEASAIEISVKPGYKVDKVINAIGEKIGPEYFVKDRLMQQETSFRMVNIEKWISFLLLGFIMIIATFNVISTVSILIVEKKNDIATLRNLGANKGFITRIFTSQTWLITLFGAIIGIIVGLLLCLGQQYFGWIKLAGDSKTLIITSYPVLVKATDIIIVLLLVIGISILSSFATSAVMHSRLKYYK